ncbi:MULTISPECIES: helix-turn-helix domain-containing protein [unclassified Gordonia (in: high G+C Gram-positive bacteria)]|mgnify:CR=1 FL=1|uniref:winged helix-turn-helix transcriptional regulator n=1 Tax=unclassified Gordonia (in: high G+C Gram-positive bacteria) TaxID=2657482 RepID=UPI001F0EF75B|nr:helix-turn-helix domain-containing protein [Gordonia sp. ABSL49_1]MCH5645280.1 helix-turn-helix transcriptional regulator [Gordonia sp. ABSL49_1]
MTRRQYGQFCGLAMGLDVVGERWTLLIVRELMAGPKRYSDLLEALDGIGTSLLASRLRQLEDAEVVLKRRLPKPSASLVYQLTESGRELSRALLPLALWGVRHQTHAPKQPDDMFRAEWPLVFIAQLIDGDVTRDARYTYRFHIDGSSATIRLRDGEVSVTESDADDPDGDVDVDITMDAATIVDVSAGRLSLTEAVTDGRIVFDGNASAAALLVEALPERITIDSGLIDQT